MILVFFLLFASFDCETITIRVLKRFASNVELSCPLLSGLVVDQIRWIDDKNSNLIASSQLCTTLYNHFEKVSCGYMSNDEFIRVKSWQIIYIEKAYTELKFNSNPTISKYSYINQSHVSLYLANSFESYDWKQAIDIIRFKCVNNFDYPLTRRFIWMYVFNPITCIDEIWHKFDSDNDQEQSIFQIFTNADNNKEEPVSNFLQMLFKDKSYYLNFQCASYFDKTSVVTISKSDLITFIHGGFFTPNYINGALIGGIVGGILGLLLLLLLLCLLIFCCLKCRKKKNKKIIEGSTKDSSISSRKSSGINIPINIENKNINSNHLVHNSNEGTYRVQPEYYLNILEIHPDPIEEIEEEQHHNIETTYHHVFNHNYRQENSSEYNIQCI